MQYKVFYASREYAYVMGDPCLGHVYAGSREEALQAASGLGGVGGEHVLPAAEQPLKGERIRCTCQLTGAVLTGEFWMRPSVDSFYLMLGSRVDGYIVRLQDKYTTIERA